MNKSQRKLIKQSLVKKLITDTHSLGGNPFIPNQLGNGKFLQNLFFDRYDKLYNETVRVNQTNELSVSEVIANSLGLLGKVRLVEEQHKESLEKLAVDIIRSEFGISEKDLKIEAELVFDNKEFVDIINNIQNNKPNINIQFDSVLDLKNVKTDIHKRRLINSMIQGVANTYNNYFHMYTDELNNLDIRLATLYQILIPNAEIMYYFMDLDDGLGVPGGVCSVCENDSKESDEDGDYKIKAKALCFPILIQEIIKGIFEVISIQGLPENNNISQFVLSKSDAIAYEGWDMLLGIPMWKNIMQCIGTNYHNLKHHVFYELVTLPMEDFFDLMPEFIGNTNRGKEEMEKICKKIQHDLRKSDLSDLLYDLDDSDDEFIDPDLLSI